MTLFSAACRGPREGLRHHLAPTAGRRFRRTATVVTASLLLSVVGPTLGGGPLGSVAWAQTAAVSASAAAEPAKTDSPPQPSADEIAAARNHFESGVAFFERGNYSAARAEFEASYQLTKYPQLLFNLGKTAEKLNQDADAIRYLEAYLAASPTASDAEEVRAKLIELRQRNPVTVVTPPPLPSEATPPSRLPPLPALILLGGGAGLLIAGIGCGAGALSTAGKFQPGETVPSSTYSQGESLNKAAIALDVIGGLALAAGGAWTGYWLYKRNRANKAPAPAVSLIPTGPGMSIVGRF